MTKRGATISLDKRLTGMIIETTKKSYGSVILWITEGVNNFLKAMIDIYDKDLGQGRKSTSEIELDFNKNVTATGTTPATTIPATPPAAGITNTPVINTTHITVSGTAPIATA